MGSTIGYDRETSRSKLTQPKLCDHRSYPVCQIQQHIHPACSLRSKAATRYATWSAAKRKIDKVSSRLTILTTRDMTHLKENEHLISHHFYASADCNHIFGQNQLISSMINKICVESVLERRLVWKFKTLALATRIKI